jgi:hypothetical protein
LWLHITERRQHAEGSLHWNRGGSVDDEQLAEA